MIRPTVGCLMIAALAIAAGCEKSDRRAEREEPEAPDDAAPGFPADLAQHLIALPDDAEAVAADPALTLIRVDQEAISIDGREVVALQNWEVGEAELGGFGPKRIERITRHLETLARSDGAGSQSAPGDEPDVAAADDDPPMDQETAAGPKAEIGEAVVAPVEKKRVGPEPSPLNLALPPEAPQSLVLQLLFSAAEAGHSSFGLLARRGDRVVAVFTELPAPQRATPVSPNAGPGPLDTGSVTDQSPALVVSVEKDTTRVWSLQGSGSQPIFESDRPISDDETRRGLMRAIAPRTGDSWVPLMIDGSVSARQVILLVAAIRDAGGAPVFAQRR